MTCPRDVELILLEILRDTIINIRSRPGDAVFCYGASDHVHNLPNLIGCYSPEGLVRYWDSERSYYLSRFPEMTDERIAALWELLRTHVDAARTGRPGPVILP